jgi:hypothetical protein
MRKVQTARKPPGLEEFRPSLQLYDLSVLIQYAVTKFLISFDKKILKPASARYDKRTRFVLKHRQHLKCSSGQAENDHAGDLDCSWCSSNAQEAASIRDGRVSAFSRD